MFGSWNTEALRSFLAMGVLHGFLHGFLVIFGIRACIDWEWTSALGKCSLIWLEHITALDFIVGFLAWRGV